MTLQYFVARNKFYNFAHIIILIEVIHTIYFLVSLCYTYLIPCKMLALEC